MSPMAVPDCEAPGLSIGNPLTAVPLPFHAYTRPADVVVITSDLLSSFISAACGATHSGKPIVFFGHPGSCFAELSMAFTPSKVCGLSLDHTGNIMSVVPS